MQVVDFSRPPPTTVDLESASQLISRKNYVQTSRAEMPLGEFAVDTGCQAWASNRLMSDRGQPLPPSCSYGVSALPHIHQALVSILLKIKQILDRCRDLCLTIIRLNNRTDLTLTWCCRYQVILFGIYNQLVQDRPVSQVGIKTLIVLRIEL